MQQQSYKIQVLTDHEAADLISDIMSEVSPLGVTVFDDVETAEAITKEALWAYPDDTLYSVDGYVKVEGYVYEEDLSSAMRLLREQAERLKGEGYKVYEIKMRPMQEQDLDWNLEWQRYYKAIEVGRYTIVPQFLLEKTDISNTIPIIINPSHGFGTGEHETTRLALRCMNSLDFTDKRTLDYGCGSGVLGIAAVKSGAKSCDLIDVSTQALENCRENISLNAVGDKTEIVAKATGKYDCIFANISDNVLLELVDELSDLIKSKGMLVLSGLKSDNAERVQLEYSRKGFIELDEYTENIWVGILMMKR